MMRISFLVVGLCAVACSQPTPAAKTLDRAALLDPQTCLGCHPSQFADWAGSMHAYAADDPVFLAMNRRGQRETNGALGTFCVGCHSPMAVREGATTDGLNLESLPKKLKGVTCFFCHSVASVEGSHNNPLTLATDNVLRGQLQNPFKNTAHASAYSPHVDRDRLESAAMCGACHDITTGHGAAIERTFSEWKGSVFSQAPGSTTCSQCHMTQSTESRPVALYPGAPTRHTHAHTFPGVDMALDDFPDKPRQHELIQSFLKATLQSALCVETLTGTNIKVILDNVAAGHGFPSGSAQDRRLWVEVIAYQGEQIVYQSGVVPASSSPVDAPDADQWLLRDCMFDESGQQVEMFWDAASYETNALPTLQTLNTNDPRYYQTHIVQSWPREGTLAMTPDRITMRVLLQPIGLEVLDNLISSGDLAASHRDAMPTLIVGDTLEWTASSATLSYSDRTTGAVGHCVSTTNINVQAERTPATRHTRCAP